MVQEWSGWNTTNVTIKHQKPLLDQTHDPHQTMVPIPTVAYANSQKLLLMGIDALN